MPEFLRFLIKWGLILLIFLLVGVSGFVFLVHQGVFGSLPSRTELRHIENEQATLVFASDSSLIGKIFATNRTNVKANQLPEHLIQALVATEDRRFFQHEGFDTRSFLRVVFKTLLLGDRSSGGGSTITQQLVKNLNGRANFGFLSLPANKIREAIIAYRMEQLYSKRQILTLYLNSVPFGENVYGIEAAAQRYFNKSTSQLKPEESALLVGILKANTYYNPRLHPDHARQRRNVVLRLMTHADFISAVEADSLSNLPLKLDYSNYQLESPAGYFVHQVKLAAQAILEELEDLPNGSYDLEMDALKIYTTLDPTLQTLTRQAARKQLAVMQPKLDADLKRHQYRRDWEKLPSQANDPLWALNPMTYGNFVTPEGLVPDSMRYQDSLWHYEKMLHVAVLMMRPKTGEVLAWVGGNNFRYLPFDMVRARRQVASTFKPILYATALENGIKPCTYLSNEEKVYPNYEDWRPENFDHSSGGQVALWNALMHSMNLPTIDLYFLTGWNKLNGVCDQLGIDLPDQPSPAVALGSADAALNDMVRAYTTFADSGRMSEQTLISRIEDAQGRLLYENYYTPAKLVFQPETAEQVTAILQRVVNGGTGQTIRTVYELKSDLAGKTGTAHSYTDGWFIAFTPDLIIGVRVGAMDPAVHFNNSQGSGAMLALPIAGTTLKTIEQSQELKAKFLSTFYIDDKYIAVMDCEPTRDPAVKNYLKDAIKEPRVTSKKIKRWFRKQFGD